jgi:ribosomal protein L14E/L6E/L27E
MDIEQSDIVVALCGRDKGKLFFVLGKAELYAFICDGSSRRIDKPKRKKLKHLRFETKSDCRAAEKIRSGGKITNSEVRKALAEYAAGNLGEKGGM